MKRFGSVGAMGAQVCRELSFAITAGRTLNDDEKLDNQKLNQMVVPNITIDGGLENTQAQLDAWGEVEDDASILNGYIGKLAEEEQDPSAIMDGAVVAFKIPVTLTNTGASTFQLKKSDGTNLTSGLPIRKNGAAVQRGDLNGGRWYELRYNATNSQWDLQSPTFADSNTIIPSPIAYGSENAAAPSTATAYRLSMTVPPTSIQAGMQVRLEVPVTNTGTVTLQLQTIGATPVVVGDPAEIHRYGARGQLASVGANELIAGQEIEVIFNGTYWVLQTPVAIDGVAFNAPASSSALVVKNNVATPNTIIDVSADELAVYTGLTGGQRLLGSVAVSANIAASGANGLDTGVAANSTWYYVWVIWNGTTTAALLSTQQASPTMPSGYTHKARVGAVYRDSGGNFVRFHQFGREVWLRPTTIFTAKAPAAGNTYEALAGADLTAFQGAVSPLAKAWSGYVASVSGSSAVRVAVAADANGMGEQIEWGAYAGATFDGMEAAGAIRCPITTAQTMYWKAYDTAAVNKLVVTGYSI